MQTEKLLTTKELAATLQICMRTAERLIQTKQIPSIRLGSRKGVRIDPADVQAFIDSRKQAA